MHRPTTGLLAVVALALPLAACGSSGNDAGSASTSPAAGGSTSTTASGGSSSNDAVTYPITIKHALGTTTIPKKPVRIATLGWANHEVPLALGVVPVGMSKVTWGDDDKDGVLPWVEDKLTELGAKTPVLFDETAGVPFEAVANTKPDVILCAYSGLTAEDYAKLSKIAPVVAYPTMPWGTSMDDMIRLDSEAIGMKPQGDELVKKLDAQVAETAAKHASLKGKKVMFASIDATDKSKIGFYTTNDPRQSFLVDEVGMATPNVVAKASQNSKSFYETISAENGDQLSDLDVAAAYGDATTVKKWQSDALVSKVPAVKRGAIAILQNDTPLAASANPSPLSIAWGLDKYLALLQAAADKK